MHIFRRAVAVPFLIFVLAMMPGCARRHITHDARYDVFGFDADPKQRTNYIGALSGNPSEQPVDITVRTFHNTVYCTGSLSPGTPGASDDFTGTGTLSCRTGGTLSVNWKALSGGTGVATGKFSSGRLIIFTYGFASSEDSTAAIRAFYAERKSELAQAPGDGKGGAAQGPKSGEKKPEAKPRWTGNGTGFFVTDDGLLITNHHVIEKAGRVAVEDTFARKTYEATVLLEDKENDLAVLKVAVKSRALPLGNSGSVRKGQEVLALGYPIMSELGMEQKATFGRVNSLTGYKGDARRFQTDATVRGGNSGGPLLNMLGEVVGVNTSIISGLMGGRVVTNVNYAVKADYVKALLTALPEHYKPLNRKGSQAPDMAELVKRCERSVVIVWTQAGKRAGR